MLIEKEFQASATPIAVISKVTENNAFRVSTQKAMSRNDFNKKAEHTLWYLQQYFRVEYIKSFQYFFCYLFKTIYEVYL